MLLCSWNVNSIRAREERALAFLKRSAPDVLCLQELKVVEEKFPLEKIQALGYHAVIHGQKTYNGVAILSKSEPSDVFYGVGDEELDAHSRLCGATIDGVHVMSAYFPNGGDATSPKYRFKLKWMARLREVLDERFKPSDPVALLGDYNVAPFDDDMALDSFRRTVLANDEVRAALTHIREFGLVDVVRPFFPHGQLYSWWDYRALGFERNHGLRIDHVYTTEILAARCVGAQVDRKEREGRGASDHAPLLVELDILGGAVRPSLQISK